MKTQRRQAGDQFASAFSREIIRFHFAVHLTGVARSFVFTRSSMPLERSIANSKIIYEENAMCAALNFPPSLPTEVRARAFEAFNGELGMLPRDATAFLDACDLDGAEVLGWDLWLVDHRDGLVGPEPSPGAWAGMIPVVQDELLNVFAFEGDAAETRAQLLALDLTVIDPIWLRHVRVNFTLV